MEWKTFSLCTYYLVRQTFSIAIETSKIPWCNIVVNILAYWEQKRGKILVSMKDTALVLCAIAQSFSNFSVLMNHLVCACSVASVVSDSL